MSVRIDEPVVVNPETDSKNGIHKKKGRIGKIKGQRAEEADGRPSHSHNGHAFALADGFGFFMPERSHQGGTDGQRDAHGLDQRQQAAIHGEKGQRPAERPWSRRKKGSTPRQRSEYSATASEYTPV
jgi:hypothetical protein